MKGLYRFHLLGLIVLLFLGGYCVYKLSIMSPPEPVEMELIGEENEVEIMRLMEQIRRENYLRKRHRIVILYGLGSLFFFAFSTLVGWKTMAKFRKVGMALVGGGIGFIIGTVFMLDSLDHIELEEVFPAWVIYIFMAIGLTIYAQRNYKYEPLLKKDYQDDILDDGI